MADLFRMMAAVRMSGHATPSAVMLLDLEDVMADEDQDVMDPEEPDAPEPPAPAPEDGEGEAGGESPEAEESDAEADPA